MTDSRPPHELEKITRRSDRSSSTTPSTSTAATTPATPACSPSDGVLVAQLGEAVGPAAIEADPRREPRPVRPRPPAGVDPRDEQPADRHRRRHRHDRGDLVLPHDRSRRRCPTILQSGRYVDDLVRENGRWKIARHDISRIMGRSPMMPAAAHATRSTLARRVQRLEDKDAIWRLFMTYKQHLDQRDFKAYASLFTDDAVWIGNLGKAVGPAADRGSCWSRRSRCGASDRERTHHLVLNPVIDVDGDTATAASNWGYVTRSERDAPVFLMLGRYLDELRRTPDGWRFSRRVAYSDIPYIDITDVEAGTRRPTSTRCLVAESAVDSLRRPGDHGLLDLGADQGRGVESGRAVVAAALPLVARHAALVRLAVGEPVLGVPVELSELDRSPVACRRRGRSSSSSGRSGSSRVSPWRGRRAARATTPAPRRAACRPGTSSARSPCTSRPTVYEMARGRRHGRRGAGAGTRHHRRPRCGGA